MAELDVNADRDAAFAMAAIYRGTESRDSFLTGFEEALFLSSAYFFKVFPASEAKPEKIARVVAVLLMLARLAEAKTGGQFLEDPRFPLDSVLLVAMTSPHKKLLISRGEPSREIIAVSNDVEAVEQMTSEICAGRIETAMKWARQIWGTARFFR